MRFKVIDPQTGKYPDVAKIALTEEWAKKLIYCDKVIIRDKPYCNWLYDASKMTRDEKLAVEALEREGYTVGLYYEEMRFVDLGLEIGW